MVKRRDADLTYNLRTFADLAAEAPGFDWTGWITALGSSPAQAAELVVRQPDYLTAFAALWSSADLDDWKRWACWRLIHARAAMLTDELVAEDFSFYGKTLSGTEEIRERWKRGVALVENLMGDALGKLYVERHFPPEHKARMDELVANLREAYRVSITEPGVDDSGDPRAGTDQARQVHRQDRLPEDRGGTIRNSSSAAMICTATTAAATRWATTANWPSSVARWTATSGS